MAKKKSKRKTRFVVDGIEYKIRYDLPLVRDIRKQLGVHILTNDGVNQVCSDVISFAEYVWHSIADQAERYDVLEDDFIRALPDSLEDVVDCWLEAVTDFFEQMGRSALAELAQALIATERQDRRESNQLMTRANAQAITRKQLKANSRRRRLALENLIGNEDGEGGGEDESLTLGQS